MSEHENELTFLRQCIRYGDADERGRLEERMTQVQRDGRCVRRAVALMALLIALGAAGLAYGALFQENFPYGQSRLVIKFLCVLELASLISLAAFAGLLMAYRKKLNRLREQCLRLAASLLESRLGKPRATALTGALKEREFQVNHEPIVN
jgi:hypothetical protein